MSNLEVQATKVIELWQPIKKNAFRIVNSVTKDPYLTEDVLQEAIIIASKKLHTLNDIDKFDNWFYKIAIRIAYGLIKERKKVIPIGKIHQNKEFNENCNQKPKNALLLIEDNDAYLSIVKDLPLRERNLIHLRFVQDMKIDEISEITGIKAGTLKSIYHRAFKKLRESYLQECINE